MTNDPQIDDIDIDNDGEDLDSGAPERASLKDTWNGNPLLKLGAVIGGVVVLAFLYFNFVGPAEEDKPKTILNTAGASDVKVVPGQEDVDEEYRQAMEKENKMRAEQALSTGGSAIPTPIGTSQNEGVVVPEAPTTPKEDPLATWRAMAESKRVLQETAAPAAQEEEAMRPDVVPMVQPVRPQAAVKMDPNAVQALAGQMRVIVAAQAPEGAKTVGITTEESPYMKLKKEKSAPEKGEGPAGMSNSPGVYGQAKAGQKVIIQAGSISYAQLLNDLNSDIKGPVLVQMLSGPLEGGRGLGQFTMMDEFLVLTFTRIVKDGVTYTVDAIALDEETTLAAQASDVDYHYFRRVILPAAASFVEGYGAAVAETGTSTTTTAGGGVASDVPEPDAKEELFKGIEKASNKVSQIIDQNANKPITVKLFRGSTMGILFNEPVTTQNAR